MYAHSFSDVWLCYLMDCSPPGSSVHGILQARILKWFAISSSRGSSQSRDRTCISCLAGRFFTTEPSGKPKPPFTWRHFQFWKWLIKRRTVIPGRTSGMRIFFNGKTNPGFTTYYLCELGNSLNFSEPHFIYLEKRGNNSARVNVTSYHWVNLNVSSFAL